MWMRVYIRSGDNGREMMYIYANHANGLTRSSNSCLSRGTTGPYCQRIRSRCVISFLLISCSSPPFLSDHRRPCRHAREANKAR